MKIEHKYITCMNVCGNIPVLSEIKVAGFNVVVKFLIGIS